MAISCHLLNNRHTNGRLPLIPNKPNTNYYVRTHLPIRKHRMSLRASMEVNSHENTGSVLELVTNTKLKFTTVVADLDPATAKLSIGILGPFLSVFGFLFIVRIVMSWYPRLPVGKFPYVIAYAPTEPILGITRKVIPPVGGVDVSPVVWFALISFLNEILVGPQGLLVLLSQQLSS